jgi:hypothetical protein
MERVDDLTISGNLLLYRRIPPTGERVTWDLDGNPDASSFNFKDPAKELSFNLANETTPDAVLSGHEGFGLVSISADEIRRICPGVIICRDDEDPANGHVLVCGRVSGGMAARLKKSAKWVEGRFPSRIVDSRGN